MRRKDFLQKVAIGSTAALVGYPLFEAQSAVSLTKRKKLGCYKISWSNSEFTTPYVDSNLCIRENGVDILNEVYTATGNLSTDSNGSNVEIIQMGIAGNSWPQGYSSYLIITVENPDGGYPNPYTIFSNEISTWKQGIIDSFTFNPYNYDQDGCLIFKVKCFTTHSGLL